MKKILFHWLFTKEEQKAIINALFRRSDDLSTADISGDEKIRSDCRNIAMKIFRNYIK